MASVNKRTSMAAPKTYRQLTLLSPAEQRQIRQLLAEKPYHSKPHLRKLFNYLIAHSHQYGHNAPVDKRILSSALFPGQDYNSVRIRDLLSQLSRIVESVLVQNTLSNSRQLTSLLIIYSLSLRPQSYSIFREESQRLIRLLEKQPEKGLHDYLQLCKLCHDCYFHPETDKFTPESLLLLQKAVHYQQLYNSLAGAVYDVEFDIRQQLLQPSPQIALSIHEAGPSITLRLIRECRQLTQDGNTEEKFHQLVGLFRAKQHQIPVFEAGLILKTLLNFAGQLSAQGHIFFTEQLHQLHLYGLSINFFDDHQPMPAIRFSNIVVAALMTGEIDWAFHFIQQYKDHLPHKDQFSIVTWCQALWAYHQGEKTRDTTHHERCIALLQQLPYEHPSLDLRIRSLQVRVGYDFIFLQQRNQQLLESWIRNFERYLWSTPQIAEHRKTAYLNFIRILRKLIRLSLKAKLPGSNKQQQLVETINQTQPLFFRKWLEKRVHTLPT